MPQHHTAGVIGVVGARRFRRLGVSKNVMAPHRLIAAIKNIAPPFAHEHTLGGAPLVSGVRIDQIGGGPDFHRWPLAPGGGASLYWEGLNKGKRRIEVAYMKKMGYIAVKKAA